MEELEANLLSRAEDAYRLAVADPAAAGPVAAALVDEARGRGEAEPLVVALRAQAWSDRTLLAGDRAKQLLDEAAQLARRAGLDVRLGEVLVVRSVVNQELGRPRAAQRDLETARPLLGATALAELEHQTAVLHHNAGRLREAAAIYRRVIADPESPAAVRAKDTNNLGMIEADFGNFGVALSLLEQAQRLAAHVGPALTAYFTEGHARVMAQAGMLPESLRMFADAERLYLAAGLPRAELYTEFADVMADLRLFPEASSAARRGRDEFDANHVPLMRAEAELRVARLALHAGDLVGAESAAAHAADSLRRQGRTGWAAAAVVVSVEARVQAGSVSLEDLHRVRRAAATLERLEMTAIAVDAHVAAARVALSVGRQPWALESFERAASLARRASVLTRLKGHKVAATAALLRGAPRESLRACRAGLRDLEDHRAALASTELRVLASAHGAELGQIGLRTLLETGSPGEVLQWMERTRAAALLAVQRDRVDGLEEELAELHALQASMRSGRGTAEEVERQTALEERIRHSTWAASGQVGRPGAPHPIAEIRELLADRTLVEYGILDGEVFAVVLTRRRVTLTRLASLTLVENELQKLLFSLRLLSRSTSSRADAHVRPLAEERIGRLRELLTIPLDLPADREVVVIPVGMLQRVPWSALHGGPISLAPSAAFWARARRTSVARAATALLVAGPDLVAAEDEVVRLGALHENRRILRPPQSTVDNVATALEGASLVHFACHGAIRSDNPVFSGLLLSDGLLTVQELDLRGVAPFRVVLAACEAAADVSYPGGEMLGFVSALLARGTAGIVASIILVPDAAAPALMAGLHDAIRTTSSAEALHLARESLDIENPRDFVNWCGFTAYGAA